MFVTKSNENRSKALHGITSGEISFISFKRFIVGCKLGKCVLINMDMKAKRMLCYVRFPRLIMHIYEKIDAVEYKKIVIHLILFFKSIFDSNYKVWIKV